MLMLNLTKYSDQDNNFPVQIIRRVQSLIEQNLQELQIIE